jgi:acetylornithine deacetylase/succinyl-diaminopimelate desuccinylase-like protein
MDPDRIESFVGAVWERSIFPALERYITIPNQSPAFDPLWREHGHMERAVTLVASWIEAQQVDGLRLEVVRLEGRTPLIFVEVDGDADSGTTLLYGHLDKQPPMHGWSEGLGPWTPVLRDGRLYGRGGADDGYAAFASVAAIKAVQTLGGRHPRCVVLIEACEESGSGDLPPYIEALAGRIGVPDLVIFLDSGCGNYDQLWITTSLRGLIGGNLHVATLSEGVHSGAAGGIVPSTFRIARLLLERLEDSSSGALRPRELYAEIPAERRAEAEAAATALGAAVPGAYPWLPGVRPHDADPAELLLALTWRPALEITGAAGLPALDAAGNVLRPETALKLSLRLPPTVDARAAAARVKSLLEADPPHGARVAFEQQEAASGWNVPPLAPWLRDSLQAASRTFFGREAQGRGEGGTIPFMAMLGARFPQAQFVITGVLGPHSNAHGPNEFLDLATARRLTACIARVLADRANEAVRRW